MQTSGVFGALSDGQRKMIYDFLKQGMSELEPLHTKLFNKRTTTHKFERMQGIAPFQDVPLKPEGAEYEFDIIQPGYAKDITPLEYGLGYLYTETADEDDDHSVLAQKSKWLGFSMRVLQETQAANVFLNGFTTQLTADGESLFDTGHLLKRGGTASNRLATDSDLSLASLEQMHQDMRLNTKLESGQLIKPSKSMFLLHGPANAFLAYQLCKSNLIPQSANNDPNPIAGVMNVSPLCWEYLGTDDAFYLVASKASAHGLIHMQRVAPKLNPERQQAETGNFIISIRSREHFDSFDWRNTAGTPGA